MEALLEKLDTRMREWPAETAVQVRKAIEEIVELADEGILDLVRSRVVEQDVLDLIDESAPR
jgi:hypothetical protein